jgi:uncharacterized SAM-binding protein YcdF (DUF218 family)
MFFYLSKILWALVAPSNLLGLAAIVGAIALFTRFARVGRRLVTAAAVLYLACGLGPVGAILLRPLEDRFPRLPADIIPAPAGIIVLGGAIDEQVTLARDTVALNESGARMTLAVALTRRFPQARLVFTGGSAALFGPSSPEADGARRLFLELGVAPERMTFEDRSRNTYENAIFTRDLVHPQPGSHWLLVTSAFHMPRAMGIFQAAGFSVTAVPADYWTRGDARDFLRLQGDATRGLKMTELGLREWIGLVAYRLAGRTDTLLPGPDNSLE